MYLLFPLLFTEPPIACVMIDWHGVLGMHNLSQASPNEGFLDFDWTASSFHTH